MDSVNIRAAAGEHAHRDWTWGMTESGWKMVMDRDVVTISGDQFQLTANGSDPAHLDTIVSQLQSMTRGTYGQYCGLSRAIEMVGERWGLLIVRDLIIDPKSAAELHAGLPRVSPTLLEMRVKEMCYSGIIREADSVDADGGQRYELTEYGRELQDVVLAFGRWGAATLSTPRPEDIVTEDSVMVALHATFVEAAALDVQLSFELHAGPVVVHAVVDRGVLTVNRGPLPGADAVIDPGTTLLPLMTREITAEQALASGVAKYTGREGAFEQFVSMFELPDLPAPKPPHGR